ncbi:hypothetical protein MESS2_1670036 [Mesorhizobium metallidurans STM 2683]|uniref:Uncharacterized protein n=1 Tax=Mesorhizobium metallidurans STM 2683 TaxID=1297569 RepID=M5ENA1_9HYPH|nr:hypothetical protein MESS2_1670036 [Mesorhizobium metallidurans STM 2683]
MRYSRMVRIRSKSRNRGGRRDLPVLHAFRPLISPEPSIVQLLPQADSDCGRAEGDGLVLSVLRPPARRVPQSLMRRLTDLPSQERGLSKSGSTQAVSMREFIRPAPDLHREAPEAVRPKAGARFGSAKNIVRLRSRFQAWHACLQCPQAFAGLGPLYSPPEMQLRFR